MRKVKDNMFMFQGRQVFWEIGRAGSIELSVPSVFFIPPDTYEELLDMAEEDAIWMSQSRKAWNMLVKTHLTH